MTTENTSDPTSGTFRLTLPNGATYAGTYAEIGKKFVAMGGVGKIERLGSSAVPSTTPGPAVTSGPTGPTVPSTNPAIPGQDEPAANGYTVGTPRTSEQAAREIETQAAMIRTATGMALPPTLYAPGTELIEVGKDRYKALHGEWSALPKIEDACEAAAKRIDAESRADRSIDDASRIEWAVERGVLHVSRDGKRFLPIEENALGQFCSRYSAVLPRAMSLLLAIDPDQRADVLNRQTRKIAKVYTEGRATNFRVRNGGSGFQVFSVTSPSYTPRDGNAVLRDYARTLAGQNLRGTVVYDAHRAMVSVRASWNAPRDLDAKVGDVFNAGLYGRTGDAGNSAHSVQPFFVRIRCLNCTTVEARGSKKSRRHVGNVVDFTRDVVTAVKAIPEAFAGFAEAWNITRQRSIDGITMIDRIKKAVEDEEIDAGIGRDALVEALLNGWSHEPGNTYADLLNAVTRAAHEGPFDDGQRAALEAEAGRLVYVYADGSVR